MLWQKEKYPRNPWKISNDLTKKTMRLHENPSKSLSCNYWRKRSEKRSPSLSWFSVLGSLARPFTAIMDQKKRFLSLSFNLVSQNYQVFRWLQPQDRSLPSLGLSFKEVKKEAKIISLAIDYNFERLLTKAVYDF